MTRGCQSRGDHPRHHEGGAYPHVPSGLLPREQDRKERRPRVRVTLEGFEGDRHAGLTRLSDARTPHYPRGTEIRNSRQVSIVSAEELSAIAVDMGLPELRPEWLGANLVLGGIPDLTHLPPSTRLLFPHDTVLVVEGENLPCTLPGQVLQDRYPHIPGLVTAFPKEAIHRRGVLGWVERSGFICEGDPVTVRITRQVPYEP